MKIPIGLALLLLIFLSSTEAAVKANAKNGQSIKSWLRSMRPKRQDNSLTSDRVWTLSDALPGVPERDYPIFAAAPDTDFSCDDKKYGYYADTQARCQVFHVCANTAPSLSKGFSFLCPNGTLFNQRFFVCDWYMNVDCEGSDKYFGLNDLIGNGMEGFTMDDIMSTAKEIMGFPSSQQPGFGAGNTGLGRGDGNRNNGLGNNNLNGNNNNNNNNNNANGANGRGGSGGGGGGVNGGNGGNGGTGGGGGGAGNRNGNRPFGAGGSTPLDRNGVPIRGSADLSQPISPGASGSNYPYAGVNQGGNGANGGRGGTGSGGGRGGNGSNGGIGGNGGNGGNGPNGSGGPSRNNAAGGGGSGGPRTSTGGGGSSSPYNGGRGSQSLPSPGRGANGGTVPDKDSQFDQDTRIPSNSFDTLKGIGNSYTFGLPGDSNAPLRGSADLSEPVDPSSFAKGGPPNLGGGQKQIYTYPHDNSLSPKQLQNGFQQPTSLSPEYTGQLNTKLNAQSPKFPSSHVYGPPATQLGSSNGQRGPASPFNQGSGGQRAPGTGSFPGQASGGPSSPFGSQNGGQSFPGGQSSVPTRFGPTAGQGSQNPGQSFPGSQSSGPSAGLRPGSGQFSGPSVGQRPGSGQSFPGSQSSGPIAGQRPGSGQFSGPTAGQRPGSGQTGFSSPSAGPARFGPSTGQSPGSGQNGFGGPSAGQSFPGSQASGPGSRFGPSTGQGSQTFPGGQRGGPSSIPGTGQPGFGGQRGGQPFPGGQAGFGGPSAGQTAGPGSRFGPSSSSSLPGAGQRGGPSSGGQSFPAGSGQRQPGFGQSYPQTQATGGQRVPSTSSSFPSPGQSSLRGPSSQSQQQQQQQHKNIPSAYQPSVPSSRGGQTPSKLYQQPNGNRQSTSNLNPFQQQQQSFVPSNQQQLSQRRQYETSVPTGKGSYYQKPQGSTSNGQSNEDFLRVILKDRNNVHDNNDHLIELIQRFVVPDGAQTRVVSAEVHPSREQESYSFQYGDNGAAPSSTSSVYQAPGSSSGFHQHSNTCGHQGY